MSNLSEICCDVCGRELEYGETVAIMCGGIVEVGFDIGSDYVDEGPIQEVLCPTCDAAVTRYIQQLRKLKRGVVVGDIDKLIDTIARHIDIPIEEE